METKNLRSNRACNTKTRNCSGTNSNNPTDLMEFYNQNHYQNRQFQTGFLSQYQYQSRQPLLPPPMPVQITATPSPLQNQRFRTQPNLKKTSWKQKPSNGEAHVPVSSINQVHQRLECKASSITEINRTMPLPHLDQNPKPETKSQSLVAIKRPDHGGQKGPVIPLLANHFLVQFNRTQRIIHYDVEISPQPSKELARIIKRKLVQENSEILSGILPAFDGRKNLYSPVEFQNDKLEFFVSLPIPTSKPLTAGDSSKPTHKQKQKLFRISFKLASKLDCKDLSNYLTNEEDSVPLPQDYLHSLDVILRESPTEKCIPVNRSLYSSSMGGIKDIGGGAIGLRGFFQSLRPTQQGLALNLDFSVTAFHESIGIIPYLQKRCEFLRDLSQRKTRGLIGEERKEVEKALKNIRVFVCHRDTDQRYRIYSLTDEVTENLQFRDRDGTDLRLVDYFKDHYNHDIQFRNLPCLQISRSKPCYLPMELCVICEGQKFLGKLSDDQTTKIINMGCQKPRERKAIINGVMGGAFGPTSGNYAREFNLHVSTEMTKLNGRVLQPPKLKLGDGGHVRDLTPTRHDRQWNLLDSHVIEGTRIDRWALISFGGTQEQRSSVPKFINQLAHRCEQLGIILTKNTIVTPQFEQMQALNSVSVLESKLRKLHEAALSNLQLVICIMERKHRGYADLKRIAETSIGVVSQCCLYPNLTKLGSQFLVNLALKINAKVGGSTVALYNSLPCQIPRLFGDNEPAIFMGADVTHPHPLDDFSPSIAAVVASMNWPAANKYISRMRSQTHRQEIIHDLREMVEELLEDFCQGVNKLPNRILFFRDGVSETQFYKVLREELEAIRNACARFPNYRPSITFVVVQKRHHTRLFPNENNSLGGRYSDENIPPGTVVDTVITHPREFDFYLCSHWGMKGTSRPTHYHILWDDSRFTSDELQRLIHNLCYTFVRCTKPVSLVPPAYYAHLAAYRGRLYLERGGAGGGVMDASSALSRTSLSTRAAPPAQATPLPKLNEKVKRLMFYC